MNTMPPEELLRLWSLEKMTVEMAAGHLIQHVLQLYKELEALKLARARCRCQLGHDANEPPHTNTPTMLYQRKGFKK